MSHRGCKDCPDRREFLRTSAQALGALVVLPPLASLAACGLGTGAHTPSVDAGHITPDCSGDAGVPSTCTVNSNTLVLALAANSALQAVGGSVMLSDSRYRDPYCGNNEFIVVQVSQGKFAAFSASCTHACCTVQPSSNGGFECPCHRSQFSLEGQVTRGPAGAPLSSIPVCFDGCSVFVQLA
jgi:nitrite reductase/ring-hydroxylating ferredoxin subunit